MRGTHSSSKRINYSSLSVFYRHYLNDCFVIRFVNEGTRKTRIVRPTEKITTFPTIIKRDENLGLDSHPFFHPFSALPRLFRDSYEFV